MAHTASFVCLVSTVNSCHKNDLRGLVLVVGTLQNLSNLHVLDIYGASIDFIAYMLGFQQLGAQKLKAHLDF